MIKPDIQVCFTPAIFPLYKKAEANVVIIDILRATSSICNAFASGVKAVIPVAEIEEAREYKKRGYMVAAERDGYVLDFADFGNSPFNFSAENVGGKEIVYSTTNGTRTITMAGGCKNILIGAFLNITAVADFLKKDGADVILLCAGWKNKFNLEDSLFAGALAKKLLDSGSFLTGCDSTLAAIDLWSVAEANLLGYIDKAAQRSRLRDKGLDDCVEFCHTNDTTEIIPVFRGGRLVVM